MKKLLKLAAVAVALTMSASAIAEAQGGGAGGGGAAGGGGGARGQGRGGGGWLNRATAPDVSADSAYNMLMTGITLDATKKAAVMTLLTKFQTDIRATPAPARGGGARGGGGGGGAVVMSAADSANFAKRTALQTTFRTEVKKHLTTEQATQLDTNWPVGGRRGGGGGGF